MPESIDYKDIKEIPAIVYVIQEIPGTKAGTPKFNIMSASRYGKFKFLLPEFSQIIFSPGPLIFKLRNLLKDWDPLCVCARARWVLRACHKVSIFTAALKTDI